MFGDDAVSDDEAEVVLNSSRVKLSRGGRWRALSVEPSPEEVSLIPNGSLPSSYNPLV